MELTQTPLNVNNNKLSICRWPCKQIKITRIVITKELHNIIVIWKLNNNQEYSQWPTHTHNFKVRVWDTYATRLKILTKILTTNDVQRHFLFTFSQAFMSKIKMVNVSKVLFFCHKAGCSYPPSDYTHLKSCSMIYRMFWNTCDPQIYDKKHFYKNVLLQSAIFPAIVVSLARNISNMYK